MQRPEWGILGPGTCRPTEAEAECTIRREKEIGQEIVGSTGELWTSGGLCFPLRWSHRRSRSLVCACIHSPVNSQYSGTVRSTYQGAGNQTGGCCGDRFCVSLEGESHGICPLPGWLSRDGVEGASRK